ncbi:hypothetical protein H5410_025589 [Solanum commersonii]|uniref:Fatty acid hydroxylase domain-containing protein n=1 Tax=Solanum commersonii TaxID=4109 RepID=A0A9J5YU71_SOLCO|nr:hypothetical protein H5410_025589 [Solanum commersonii]
MDKSLRCGHQLEVINGGFELNLNKLQWDNNLVIFWKSIMAEFTRAQHFVTACHACLVCLQPIELHQHPHLHPQLVADVYLNVLERKDVHETRRDLHKIFTSKQNQLFKRKDVHETRRDLHKMSTSMQNQLFKENLDTIGGALAFLVSSMSPRTSIFFFSFATIKTVVDHYGLWFPGNLFHIFFKNNSAYHDIHHQLNGTKYNYSQPFFVTWDRILGTYMPYELERRPEGGFEAKPIVVVRNI